MENASSTDTSFVLLGLMEMARQKYVFFLLATALYIAILVLNLVIVYAVLKEQSLHEPMYILIANLLVNEIYGSSSFFPKLISDLITSSKSISRSGCLLQSLCITSFAFFELNTFSIMAYDRYLAICHPLQYVTLMTNDRVLTAVAACWVISLIFISILVALGWNLPLCRDKINNIFCDNMSFVILSCEDTSRIKIYSATIASVYFILTVLFTVFSYLRIFIVSLSASSHSRQKAVHTVVTHLLNFSIFLVGSLFIFLRYRLETVTLSLISHVLLSATPLVFPPLCNPLIYGIRTHALKIKVTQYLGAGKQWNPVTSESEDRAERRDGNPHHSILAEESLVRRINKDGKIRSLEASRHSKYHSSGRHSASESVKTTSNSMDPERSILGSSRVTETLLFSYKLNTRKIYRKHFAFSPTLTSSKQRAFFHKLSVSYIT
ncbi:olfactory receptor 11A1-like [Gastrophryne carolinensis]